MLFSQCELTGDLVDSCVPGDVITVTGIVKARKSDTRRGPQNSSKCLFILYIDVNCVSNANKLEHSKLDVMQFSNPDMHLIAQIAMQEDIFKLLVHSLCPSIFGHEIVKAGLLLGLFGGNPKNTKKSEVSTRGDSHILVVGDPGLGKSQMLRAVAKVAPRGVYVCGNTATSSGLTVTMVKDGKGGDYALEAGALVLADQGVCCIDEFDKLGSDHNSLLEAMEQQSISIAKAGIVCNLAARTSVMAAANPAGGHYNRGKTVAENLKMPTPLLSRFDLIFILLDNPDTARDQLLSEHVIALHSSHGPKPGANAGGSRGQAATPNPRVTREQKDDIINTQILNTQASGWARGKPLSERLRLSPREDAALDRLPAVLLRKFVAYARKYVQPRLSNGAKAVLTNFFLKLRKDHQSPDGAPITTRQLESLVRLSEARAKCELRTVVTQEDAEDVVDIMKESMFDVYCDEFNHIDFRRGKGLSKGKQASVFMKALHRRAATKQSSLFSIKVGIYYSSRLMIYLF
jgi:DNA helicase MCM8